MCKHHASGSKVPHVHDSGADRGELSAHTLIALAAKKWSPLPIA